MHRLRKDLCTIHSIIDDIEITNEHLPTYIQRLQTLVDQIERNIDAEATLLSNRIQKSLKGANFAVSNGMFESFSWSPAASLRRRATSVSQTIGWRLANFIRSNGFVDFENIWSTIQHTLDSVGVLWMRLNGLKSSATLPKSDTKSNSPLSPSSLFPSDDTAHAINFSALQNPENESRLRQKIGLLKKNLLELSHKREFLIRKDDHISELIRAREIRQMDENVNALRRTLAVRALQLDLEKIVGVVIEEIDNAEYTSILDQRVLIIEFGDLDKRLATLALFVEQNEALLIEDEIIGALTADIQDMKMRLGLDVPLYSSARFNWGQIKQFLASSSRRVQDGFEFYSRGMRLFFGDVAFAGRLIKRAVLGHTPSAREIRTLRRTGRDMLTLVPFTIVLIAPLTPVGHILIFSFLQRYWPEFFPSTFSERRQTMMKKRELYVKMLQNEESFDDKSTEGVSSSRRSESRAFWASSNFSVGGRRLSLEQERLHTHRTFPKEMTSRTGTKVYQNRIVSENFKRKHINLGDGLNQEIESDKYAHGKRIMSVFEDLHLAE